MENQESGGFYENESESTFNVPTSPSRKVYSPQLQQQQQQQLSCWLYVSRSYGPVQQEAGRDGLSRASLEEAIRATEPRAGWHVSETHCGLIAGFACDADADRLLQRTDLAGIFEGPVQVARFSDRDTRYRQAVLLRDVPWAIPLQDLCSALARQGVSTGSVERLRHYVRVEVLEANQYEQLLRQGVDFFGARFYAVPERWWRGPQTGPNQLNELGPNNHVQPVQAQHQAQQQPSGTEDVLQCYRCQGFWHVAANCRHLPRCVRCGEPHSVEFCSRPRNNPVCCHCSGPHHAGYRQCPVRLQLLNATPVSLTLSTNQLNSSSASNVSQFSLYGKPSSGNSSAVPVPSTPGQRSSQSG